MAFKLFYHTFHYKDILDSTNFIFLEKFKCSAAKSHKLRNHNQIYRRRFTGNLAGA